MTDPNDPITGGVVTVPGYGTDRPMTLPNGETVWASNSEGLTKREYFAAKAHVPDVIVKAYAVSAELEGLEGLKLMVSLIARTKLMIADALIAELNKQP